MHVNQNFEDFDVDLLNGIESGSLRINQQSKALNSEIKQR
jgi:hypothetical protein